MKAAAPPPVAYPGERQCACGVWMTDDARPHCAVCELRRAPHLVIVDGRYRMVTP